MLLHFVLFQVAQSRCTPATSAFRKQVITTALCRDPACQYGLILAGIPSQHLALYFTTGFQCTCTECCALIHLFVLWYCCCLALPDTLCLDNRVCVCYWTLSGNEGYKFITLHWLPLLFQSLSETNNCSQASCQAYSLLW